MVKLDNWQTKAEKAAERRVAGKERKKRRDRTRTNKAVSHKLMALLDQHNDRILLSSSAPEIHVWVDTPPSDYYATIDEENEEEGTPPAGSFKSPEKKKKKKQGRPRSNSLMEAALTSSPTSGGFGVGVKKGGRARSNSETNASLAPTGSGGKKQKGRPRSNSNASEHQDDSEQENPKMPCQAFFFEKQNRNNSNGSRNNKLWRKTSSGSLCGSPSQNRTLGDVLLDGEESAKESLLASQQAAEAFFAEDGAVMGHSILMDVVYHLSVAMPQTGDDADDDRSLTSVSISETVLGALSKKSCCLGSIVYLSLSGILVFDRYRDGVVLTGDEEHALFYGNDGSKRRSVSIGDYHDTDAIDQDQVVENIRTHHQNLVMYLPGQVLEYVLTFLPDSATALAPMVCKSWSNEIGRTSPNLWKQLLKRNGWPMPPPVSQQSAMDARNMYRDGFLSHYTALRDLKGLANGLDHVMDRQPLRNQDVAVRQVQNASASDPSIVRIWSPARSILARRDACTLSLVDVVATSSNARCRQSICVIVEPFRSSRRRSCSLVAMDLDDRLTVCLFNVWNHGTSEDAPTPYLGIVERDYLLCSGGFDRLEEGVTFVSLREKVLEFILIRAGVEPLGWPFDFLDEFTIASLEVIFRESIVATGNGHFLFEVVVTFPPTIYDDSDAPDAHVVRLAMFSASTGEISWIGPSSNGEDSPAITPYRESSTIVACTPNAGTNDGDCQNTRVTFVSDDHSKQFTTLDIFRNGSAKEAEKRGNTQVLAERITQDNPSWRHSPSNATWRHSPSNGGLALVTATEVIYVNCYVDSAQNNSWMSVLSFHSTQGDVPVEGNAPVDILSTTGRCHYETATCLRGDHMVVFVEERDETVEESLFAVLVHIPSRRELRRIHIGDSSACSLAYSLSARGNTLAMATDCGGMFLAGRDVSSLTREHDADGMDSSKKKKGARKRRVGNKKDGFARGMRQSSGG